MIAKNILRLELDLILNIVGGIWVPKLVGALSLRGLKNT